MTNKTYNHGVCKGAIALGTGCMRCERCAEQLAARVKELESELESVGAGGVQALRAVPTGLLDAARMAVDALDWLPTSDQTNALWQRQQPALEALRAALAASPTPPALSAAPAQRDGRKCYMCGHPASAHPMEPDPRGGMRRGGCPPAASPTPPPAEKPGTTPAGWLPVHSNGRGFYGGPLKTEDEAKRYISQVEQSNDSVTLVARAFVWADEQQAAPRAALGEPSDWKPLKTSKEGRDAVHSFFREKLKRHDFDEYIMGTLAADFACVLGGYLRAAPQKEAQEPANLPDVEDMAHSAVQEALSYGVNHDLIHRWMRAVMDKTVAALTKPAPAPLSDDTKRLAWMADGWTPGHEKLYAQHVLESDCDQ